MIKWDMMQFFFLFSKQTKQNKYWVIRISLYPCVPSNLADLLQEKRNALAGKILSQSVGKQEAFVMLKWFGQAEINREERVATWNSFLSEQS